MEREVCGKNKNYISLLENNRAKLNLNTFKNTDRELMNRAGPNTPTPPNKFKSTALFYLNKNLIM